MKLTTKSGKALNPIGIGTWNIASKATSDVGSRYRGVVPDPATREVGVQGIRHSLELGQNHLDCAELYGGFYTDEVVGEAIQGQKREDLFIADKLWKCSVGQGQVEPTVREMLRKLGTDYLDMLYIHWPWDDDADWTEAVPQIGDLIDQGVVRYFGVSNFTVDDMEKARKLARHPLAANQMNYNVLYKDEVDEEFREYCRAHDIQIVAYQPVKQGEVLANETIAEIAGAQDATPAQVALAWLVQMGTLPIPKAVNPAHIDENLGALHVKLTDRDMERLAAL